MSSACLCGCGTALGSGRRYVKGHTLRSHAGRPAAPSGPQNGNWRGGASIDVNGYRRLNVGGRRLLEHRIVVERALGRPLPESAVVHHVNGDRLDNRPQNLVACDGVQYHKLLHTRQEALDACGNPSWRRCEVCKHFDAPERLSVSASRARARHPECHRRAEQMRRAAKLEASLAVELAGAL